MKSTLPLIAASTFALITATLGHAGTPEVPDWALPGSATHQQVPPPVGFHRASRTVLEPIGVFQGQTDVGGALVPGTSYFDPAHGTYVIKSAGYNIWYQRDEFRYLWSKVSGDVSLATDVVFANPAGYGDRKVVLVLRDDLDDDSREIMVALHGAGLIHLAERPSKGADIKEDHRIEAAKVAAASHGGTIRIGIERLGDRVQLKVGYNGGPLETVGEPVPFAFKGVFYAGVGFCSHQPVTLDEADLAKVSFSTSGN